MQDGVGAHIPSQLDQIEPGPPIQEMAQILNPLAGRKRGTVGSEPLLK
jgi:hypothetical protein